MKILTKRDREILTSLVFHVPVFSIDQLLDHWWPRTAAGRKNGQRRLRMFCERGALVRRVMHAKDVRRVELMFAAPLGAAPGDCAELARESQRRWKLPIRRVPVVMASERCRRVFGGYPRRRFHALHSLNHALGVSALYLEVLRTHPRARERWIGEHEFPEPQFGEAQPDALLAADLGDPMIALEFAAEYGAERFRRLQNTLISRLPYEIWGAAG